MYNRVRAKLIFRFEIVDLYMPNLVYQCFKKSILTSSSTKSLKYSTQSLDILVECITFPVIMEM